MLRFLTRPVKIGLASTAVLGGSAYGYKQWQIAHPPLETQSPETRPPVKGYKAFNYNLTCMGNHQYKVGQTYTLPKGEKPRLCKQGYHFCQFPPDCNRYYDNDNDTRYAEVEAWDVTHDDDKSVAGKLRVVREIPKAEWDSMSGVFVKDDKSTYHMKDGKLHREDGPAEIHPDGTQRWYHKGEKHRQDEPAEIYPDGTQRWYHKGQLHRQDGPAVEKANGAKLWMKEGLYHREDGPAYERPDGYKEWYRDGLRRNEDGSRYIGYDADY